MRKFTGALSNQITMCLFLLLIPVMFCFAIYDVNRHMNVSDVLYYLIYIVTGLLMSTGVIYSLLDLFVSYTVDASGITRHGWNGTQEMRWSDVARIGMNGKRDAPLTLTDHSGCKLVIKCIMMHPTTIEEFNTLMEPYLAPVRERQIRDLGTIGDIYQPSREMLWVGVLIIALACLIGGFFASVPGDGQGGAFLLMVVLIVGGLLLGLGITIHGFTHTLTLTTSGLKERKLFRTCEIPFHHVTAVGSRTLHPKEGGYETTRLEGDGHRIDFNAQMENYPLLLEYIRRHVSSEALATGEIQAQEITARELRKGRRRFYIVVGIGMLIPIAAGVICILIYSATLADYRRLESQGQRTVGTVIGKHIDAPNSRTPTYRVEYTFNDENGAHHQGTTATSSKYYQTAHTGGPVQVVYVPNSKLFSLVKDAEDRDRDKQEAEHDIQIGYVFIGMGFMPLLIVIFFQKRKKTVTP